jgi:DNA-directed RNA polymerase specialized sigma24 family protein
MSQTPVMCSEALSNSAVVCASPDVASRTATESESQQISRFISLAPPPQVIAYLLHLLGFAVEEIAMRWKTTLHVLLRDTAKRLVQDPSLLNEDPSVWLEPLRRNLKLEVGSLPAARHLLRYGGSVQGAVCGETKLQDYSLHDPANDIKRWIENVEDLCLIGRYLDGHEEAFDELYERHQNVMQGFFGARTRNGDSVTDLCQETWPKVIEKLSQFDPSRGCFAQFWRYWASIKLLQFWKKEANYRRFFMDFAEIQARFPGIENEAEIIALLGELPIAASQEELPAYPREFNQLLLTTLGGKSPPHQLTAFILVILLESTPARVVRELSHIRLDELVPRLEAELAKEFEPNEEIVHLSLQCLRGIMRDQKKLSELFANNGTKASYTHILDRTAAETCLADYFTSEAAPGTKAYLEDCAQNITNWWVNVKKRVIADLLKTPEEQSLESGGQPAGYMSVCLTLADGGELKVSG